jgi:putative transposase
MRLFDAPTDYTAFETILAETIHSFKLRICAYCIMPNHWHFVVWPESDSDLGAFFQRLTVTHAARWQRSRQRVGLGHVYQGRFKSFPVQHDDHFYQVVRYVERNPVRARLVANAAEWRWSSLWVREHGAAAQRALFSDWPVPIPRDWSSWVDQPQTEAELAALRKSALRGSPFGIPGWVEETARDLRLEYTLRPRGRSAKST